MSRILSYLFIPAKRLLREGYTYQAAALAYTTLICLVPLLAVILFLITLFPIFTGIMNLTRHYLETNFIPSASSTILSYLQNFTEQAVRLPVISILFLLFSAILLIITIDDVLNAIWKTEKHKKKIIAFMLSWLLLLFMPFIIGISVFISSWLFSSNWFINLVAALGIKGITLTILSLLINTLIFGVFYIAVPKYKIKWRDGFLGGVIAAVLFEGAKLIFGFYVQQFGGYAAIYGAMAVVPIFLVWLYIYWLIILYGALFVYEKYKRRERPTG